MTVPAHYELAKSEIGVHEVPGARHNPKIVQMFRDVGHSEVDNDETAWCAAAVGSWLERSGIPSTGKLHARSYLGWGIEVGDKDDLEGCQEGDVLVFWRGSPNSWQGHVGLYAGHDDKYVYVLGGNQKNAVRVSWFPRRKILSVRRAVNAPAVSKKPGRKFTEGFLRQLAPRGSNALITALPDLLNELLPKYGITTPRRISPFLANILTETGGFSALEENLNYSAKRLMVIWPKRFPNLKSTRAYAGNPEALANLVYDRWGNKGHKGYGWKYRGRGLMQTTFINNYMAVQEATGLPVVANPDLLLEPRNALMAACLYWQQNGCNELADQNRITEIRRVINGGTHGLSHVKAYHHKILPMVKDFDLSNTTVKVTTGLTTLAAGGGLSTGGWIAIGIFALAVIGIAGFIGYRKWRNAKDVQESLELAGWLEDTVVEPDIDLSVGSADHTTARHQYLDGDGYEPAAAA